MFYLVDRSPTCYCCSPEGRVYRSPLQLIAWTELSSWCQTALNSADCWWAEGCWLLVLPHKGNSMITSLPHHATSCISIKIMRETERQRVVPSQSDSLACDTSHKPWASVTRYSARSRFQLLLTRHNNLALLSAQTDIHTSQTISY